MGDLEKVVVYQHHAGYSELFKEYGAQDERPDLNDDVADPIATFWHGATVAALAKADKPANILLDMSVPESDVDDDASFYKNPVIVKDDGHRTLAKNLGVVRTERVTTADGDVWINAFNCRNELVDARVLRSRD